MGIQEFIMKKKAAFQAARSTDKLELQKAMLMKDRKERQKRSDLKQSIAKEKRQIRDLKTAPVRNALKGFTSGVKQFSRGASKASQNISQLGGTTKGPFSPDTNPFGPDKPRKTKKASTKNITIKIGR